MEKCHPRSVEILEAFLERLVSKGDMRALDCCGGDARLSEALFTKLYRSVDLFDQCSHGLNKANLALQNNPGKG